jgi:hypothetical protein
MKPLHTLTDDEFERVARDAAALRDAPPALISGAIGLWRAAQPSPLATVAATAEGVLQRIRAVLTFDSWAVAPTALGLRSMPAHTASRHMLFSAAGRDIDLRILSAANSYVIAGQILGPDDRGMVELTVDTSSDRAAQTIRSVPLDDLGAFRMADVRAGTYWMSLRLGDEAVDLPLINVGERAD